MLDADRLPKRSGESASGEVLLEARSETIGSPIDVDNWPKRSGLSDSGEVSFERPSETIESPALQHRSRQPRRSRWWFVSTVAVIALLGGLGTAGWVQSTYPGGVEQGASDVGGPPVLSELDIQANARRALLTTLAPHWRQAVISQGSAFFFEGGTEVVTAAHVLPDPLFQLTVQDGLGTVHPAELLRLDTSDDVAVLRVQGMTPLPLQSAVHPVHPKSQVYLAGNPGGSAPGTVVSGQVVNTHYDTTIEGRSVTGAILVSGGPFAQGMSGGPVLDAWGKVIGFIDAGTTDGREAVVVPLSGFEPLATSATSEGQTIYIGPPLIQAPPAQLVLGPSYFQYRIAKQNGNEISYGVGAANSSFIRGYLWVGYFPTIAAAAADKGTCRNHLGNWTNVANTAISVGDGGRLFTSGDSYNGLLMVCWSERNVSVMWWVVTRNYNERPFFNSIINEQQRVLYNAI
jgi:S1-C subfamily serine protease